jgi:hypothetical protein
VYGDLRSTKSAKGLRDLVQAGGRQPGARLGFSRNRGIPNGLDFNLRH